MLVNAIKSEVEVRGASRPLVFGVSFAFQRAAERKFDRPFGEILQSIEEMLIDDVAWLFWAGLQRHHPEIALDQIEGLIDEIGPGAMWNAIREAITLAYDIGKPDPDDPARPRKARGKSGT